MARRSRLTDMVYDEISVVDRGGGVDATDADVGPYVVLFKRDTSDDVLEKGNPTGEDVHVPQARNSKGGSKQVKCRSCGYVYDKKQGECPDCGEPNMSQSRLAKGLREFFAAGDNEVIEKDDDDNPTAVEEDVDLTDEDLEELADALADVFEGDDEEDETEQHTQPEGTMGQAPNTKPDLEGLDPSVKDYIESLEAQVPDEASTEEEKTEALMKSLDPRLAEIVQKSQADARESRERVEELVAKNEKNHYEEIAKSYEHLPVEADKTGSALQVLAKADSDAYAEVSRILKAADAQIAEGDLFKQMGKQYAPDADDPVEKRAAEISKSDGITLEQARVKAYEENPQAYDKEIEGV